MLEYLLGILCVVALVLAGFAKLIVYAVNRRQAEYLKTAELDLSGQAFRSALKKVEKDWRTFDPITTLGYEPSFAPSVKNFSPVSQNTQCFFAKTARLWGSTPWNHNKSVEDNVLENIHPFTVFLQAAKGLHLDGFVLEIVGKEPVKSVEEFGELVYRALYTLSKHDPHKVHCMDKSYIGKRGWWFEFANEFIFITTFSTCYPSNHSRYMFDANPRSNFILFQPEYSFAWKNIECIPSPTTNWKDPNSVRDKIRVSYKSNGRNYRPDPEERDLIGANQIVPPLSVSDPPVQWWNVQM